MRPNRILLNAHLALLGANIIYGLNYSIAKLLMPDYIKPLGLVALRAIVATSLFWIFSFVFPREKVDRKDLLFMLAFFSFGVFFNQVFFLSGLDRTSPINASLLMLLIPILVIIFGYILLKERLSAKRILGVMIGMTGTIILILGKENFAVGKGSLMGDVLILLTALSWAFFLVIIKRMTNKYSSFTVMKWVFLFGLFPNVAIGFNQLTEVNFVNLPLIVIGGLVYVTLFTTFIGYNMNVYGLKYVSPTVVSTYVYLQPVIAVIVSIILGQDELNLIKVFSAILVFLGVYMVSFTGTKIKQPH